MEKREHRPPLTDEEKAEKRRLKAAFDRAKSRWKGEHGEKLTDQRLGELVAEKLGRDEPYSQGAIWQFKSEKSRTRIPAEFVQAMAHLLGFPVEEISPRFLPKPPPYLANQDSLFDQTDPDMRRVLQRMSAASPEKRALVRYMADRILDDPED